MKTAEIQLEKFDDLFYHGENIDHQVCETLVNQKDGKCDCQLKDIRKFLQESMKEQTKEIEKDLAVIEFDGYTDDDGFDWLTRNELSRQIKNYFESL